MIRIQARPVATVAPMAIGLESEKNAETLLSVPHKCSIHTGMLVLRGFAVSP